MILTQLLLQHGKSPKPPCTDKCRGHVPQGWWQDPVLHIILFFMLESNQCTMQKFSFSNVKVQRWCTLRRCRMLGFVVKKLELNSICISVKIFLQILKIMGHIDFICKSYGCSMVGLKILQFQNFCSNKERSHIMMCDKMVCLTSIHSIYWP